MARQDYFPTRDSDLTDWTSNFDTKLSTHAFALGISGNEQAALTTATQSIRTAISDNTAAQATARKATADKVAKIAEAEATIRSIVKRAKTSSSYTEAIGHDLKVIGVDELHDWATYKPVIAAETFPGHVVINFQKMGAQGVNIYERLKGTAEWTKLAFDSHSPYTDNRPSATPGQSENREYMAIGVVYDDEVGQQSDIVPVVFAG